MCFIAANSIIRSISKKDTAKYVANRLLLLNYPDRRPRLIMMSSANILLDVLYSPYDGLVKLFVAIV